jgi:hypothetical protein
MAEWKVVLKLADMLDLGDLRQAAIEQLQALLTAAHAADRLQLAYDFHIDAWIMPAVQDLVTRTAPIGEAEIAVLHPRHLARVLEVRDVNLRGASAGLAVMGRGRPDNVSSADAVYPLSSEARTTAERIFGHAFAQPQPPLWQERHPFFIGPRGRRG